jgi:hypothetical protein
MKFGWWVFIGLIVLGVGGGWVFRSWHQPPASPPSATPSAGSAAGARPQDHSEPLARPISRKKRVGGLDVTFLVASDTHIGFKTPEDPGRDPLIEPSSIERTNLAMIESMNTIAGKSYPSALGGQVQKPRGVLISGDLTEDGGREQWRLWTRMFGLTGTEGALKFPVFEGAGNHDRNKNWYVREQVAKRHGGRFYYFDWGDLRLICLDEGPDAAGLEVLAEALAGVERDVPVILYFHYPLLGAFSDDQWFGRGDFRQRLARAIRGYRVLGLFHGHYHATGAYRWEGFDIYNVGSPKHSHTSFAVVQVKDDRMQVAAYDYLHHLWIWWHRKPLAPGGPKERIGVAPGLEPELVPDFSLHLEPRTR